MLLNVFHRFNITFKADLVFKELTELEQKVPDDLKSEVGKLKADVHLIIENCVWLKKKLGFDDQEILQNALAIARELNQTDFGDVLKRELEVPDKEIARDGEEIKKLIKSCL